MNRASQAGVSLIEALVALVVMAIGAVAVVGMQATLRLNGDIAKQRAEAVRIGQQLIEDWRGFTAFAATAGAIDWQDIADTTTDIVGSNATFTRTATVVAFGAADDNPLSKTIEVVVSWTDRTNAAQSITLQTAIAGVSPELGGSLSIPADRSLLKNPLGRQPGIPVGAIDQGDGTSIFSPPGGSGATWHFNNTTGLIDKVCPPSPATCGTETAAFLTGFVRFETGLAQPTPAQTENPTGLAVTLQVYVDQAYPIDQDVACYHAYGSTYIEYFCAVPLNIIDQARWSGRSLLSGLPLATSPSDVSASAYRVCRYTTGADNSETVPDDLGNEDHPLDYVLVDAPLTNQNFLVIRAGSGTAAFTCPDDDASTPQVNGRTLSHQPASMP